MNNINANLVPWRPPGLVVAIQMWEGDRDRALRLARLLADIEPEYRSDMVVVLSRRHDLETSPAELETVMHCNQKFVTYSVQVERLKDPKLQADGVYAARIARVGHPDGSNDLWDGTMSALHARWFSGDLNYPFVFTVEADGCPIAHDWARRLLRAHERSLIEGKNVTGPLMRLPFAHVNGTMVLNLGWWADHPSLRHTPDGLAWDLFHRETFVAACRPTQEIRNIYGAREWSNAQLEPMANETAWLASTKDDSAIRWAEATLVP